jgi:hypothetical protein
VVQNAAPLGSCNWHYQKLALPHELGSCLRLTFPLTRHLSILCRKSSLLLPQISEDLSPIAPLKIENIYFFWLVTITRNKILSTIFLSSSLFSLGLIAFSIQVLFVLPGGHVVYGKLLHTFFVPKNSGSSS